jgi:serine phosphatase RsbU (regulator of sigma subunit)
LPLGLVPDADFNETEIRLAGGDRLTLYTDGLPEARNEAGELFGFARVAEFLLAKPDAAQIAEAAEHFGQEDDITVLTFAFGGSI